MRYLVEQVAHLAAERDFGRGINFQDAGDDGNINAAVCHHRLSVEMHHARFTTDDGDLLCFHCLDFAIAVYLTGKELKIAFNANYLMQALRAIGEKEVYLDFTTGINPCVITAAQEGDFYYLVLPVRIYGA